MNIGRRKFLKSLALAGAIATMGFSECVSTPEPTPTPTPTPIPTPKPSASEPKQTPTTKTFFDVGTELKQCPACGVMMYLRDAYGRLFWVCQNVDECGWSELVTEPEILRKYGYTDQLKSI
ncbi:MAG: hypothetical protein PHS47_02690 [Methanocellales archaeon]|nr:hypothetical protein [Methanocellales archaeon]MDD3421193.1 hypothetical protein [Methanocellales archaeon]MDD4898879.1 hypothetical protein [Methanocellales archaeon]MDD5447092.1 hypothetical protein [Methanocellales archaeon]